MAYSNWGAFVHKNGERRKDKEDVAVFNTDEADVPSGMRIFANLMKNSAKYGEGDSGVKDTPWHEHSHHAVLGDGPVRLCGYKCNPELWVMKPDGAVEQIELPDICNHDGEIKDASTHFYVYADEYGKEKKEEMKEAEGEYVYSARHYNGNMIELELIEPNGNRWSAISGYEYGAGHME